MPNRRAQTRKIRAAVNAIPFVKKGNVHVFLKHGVINGYLDQSLTWTDEQQDQVRDAFMSVLRARV